MKDGFRFEVAGKGKTTARIYRASDPIQATLVLGHGAGAGQDHPFMVTIATRLSKAGVDVVTFDFPYMSAGKKMPDPNDDLEACWRAAIASVRARGGLPTERLFIGGKSMGGRIASQVAAAADGLQLSGLVFLGYPLHPEGKPQVRRDAHLPKIPFPMLFVQGSRDELGSEKEMRALVKTLPLAKIHVIQGADHMFEIRKRDARPPKYESVYEEMTQAVVAFLERP